MVIRDCESIPVGGALASTFGAKAPPTINETMTDKSLNYDVSSFQEYFHSLISYEAGADTEHLSDPAETRSFLRVRIFVVLCFKFNDYP